MQCLSLLLSVIKTVYAPVMRQFPRAAQNRLNTCDELTNMKQFGKNGRGLFVVGLMDRHGIGSYPRDGGWAARLRWLPHSALVVITQEVVAKLLLDPYTRPDIAASPLGISKMRWFIWDVWEHYGQQACEDLCERLEESLVVEMTSQFHQVLTVAKLAGQW